MLQKLITIKKSIIKIAAPIICTSIFITANSYAITNTENINLTALKPYFLKTKLIDAKAMQHAGHILPTDKKGEKFYKPFNIFFAAGINPRQNNKYALINITHDISSQTGQNKPKTLGYLVNINQFAKPIKTYANNLAIFKTPNPIDNKIPHQVMLSIDSSKNLNNKNINVISLKKPLALPNNTKIIDIINPKSPHPSIIINQGSKSGIKTGMNLASAKYTKCKEPPCLPSVAEHSTINKSILIYQTTNNLSLGLIIDNNKNPKTNKINIGDPIIIKQ
jgi:hypothetical protein